MKRIYFLLVTLAFVFCACSPVDEGVIDDAKTPGTEQDGSSGSGSDEGTTGDIPNGGGEEGDPVIFEIENPVRTVLYNALSEKFSVICQDVKQLTVTIDENCAEWFFFEEVKDGQLCFRIDDNNGEELRTAEAVVTDAVTGASVMINVTQLAKPKPYIKLIPDAFPEVESMGGVYDLTLEALVGDAGLVTLYDGETSFPDWCWDICPEAPVFDTETGVCTYKYTFDVQPNLSSESRSVVVSFSCTEYNLVAELTISQKGYVSDGMQTQLRYTTTDGSIVANGVFDAPIISNLYADGEGVITFDGTLRLVKAFNSSKLLSVILPESVEVLGDSAMCGGSSLQKVVIGGNVKRMGYAIFEMSGDMRNGFEVEVNSPIGDQSLALSNITKVVCGSGVTSIGEEAFLYSLDLETIKFAEGLKTIGNRAFYQTGLRNVRLPNSLEAVGSKAFQSCKSLETVVVGNKDGECEIKEFGSYAFYESKVSSFVCYAETPPTYGEYMLCEANEDGTSLVPSSCVISVPSNAWKLYRSAAGWSAHVQYISSITTALENSLKDIE